MNSPAVWPDDNLIRETVTQVLHRPEFSKVSESPWYLELIHWLQRAGDKLSVWAQAHPALAWLLFLALALVLVALLAHLLYVAFGNSLPWRPRKGARLGTPQPWAILEGAADSWAAGLAKARAALGSGDLRLALWITHRVLLGLLDAGGSIQFAKAKTNSDYLRECAADHPWHELLRRLTGVYEEVVYGHRAVAGALVEELVGGVISCHRSGEHAA